MIIEKASSAEMIAAIMGFSFVICVTCLKFRTATRRLHLRGFAIFYMLGSGNRKRQRHDLAAL